jgi:tRNA dimethylallyltransferase
VDEVRRLSELPRGLSQSARQALGYKELLDVLEQKTDLPQAVETIRKRTRQFAKRQHTWYRNLVECREIQIAPESSVIEIVERIGV